MRTLAICMILLCLLLDGFGQSFIKDQKRLTRISKKIAKKKFIKLWQEGDHVLWPQAYLKARKLNFVPIPSFVLSKEATGYDSTRHIVDYLIPNKTHLLELALLFQKSSKRIHEVLFDGTVDCFDAVFSNDDTPCHLDDSKGDEAKTVNYLLKQGFEALSSRKYSFLFSVRHVRNCFWFVEDNKVYLLDLEEKKVYDPDEYIKAKCSAKVIRDLAAGVVTRICN